MTTQLEFERTIRAFVADGSRLDPSLVIPGNDAGKRPKDAYASLLLIDDDRLAYPVRYQQPDETVTTLTYRRASYSLQFHRDGAVDLARAFVRFAESENGLTAAEDGDFRVVQSPPLSVQRLDVVLGDSWEQRALVSLSIDYADLSNQDAGYIDAYDCEVVYGDATASGQITPEG